jgi:carbon monoxide dehydrogenase subunit G
VTPIVASVVVAVPATDAWAAMTDWVRQGDWMPLTTVAVRHGDGGLGTRLSARTGVRLAAVVDEMEIDVRDPPSRCEVTHTGRVIRGRGVFEVTPVDASSSRVTWTEQLDGALVRLTAPAGRWGLDVALRRFADSLAHE